jgi:hypothetical protein
MNQCFTPFGVELKGALRLEFGGLPPVSWLVSLAQAARGVD